MLLGEEQHYQGLQSGSSQCARKLCGNGVGVGTASGRQSAAAVIFRKTCCLGCCWCRNSIEACDEQHQCDLSCEVAITVSRVPFALTSSKVTDFYTHYMIDQTAIL